MEFRVNDLVRVKSFKKIKKILNVHRKYQGLYFNPQMESFCSHVYKIESIYNTSSPRVRLKDTKGDVVPWTWAVDWLEKVENGERRNVFPIDVTDLNKAIEEVKQRHLEVSKHKLSDDEMEAVFQLMDKYVVEAVRKGCSIVFYVDDPNRQVSLCSDFGNKISDFAKRNSKVTAYCSPNDEFNPTVGKLVCLCKLLGHKISDWI